MKGRRLYFVICMVACLLASLLPGASLAADNQYDLWVGSVQVTDANRDDITQAINAVEPGAASGVATFAPATNTLTLDGFSYSGAGSVHPDMVVASIDVSTALSCGLDTLNITLRNANQLFLVPGDTPRAYGLQTAGGLIITQESTGSLKVVAGAPSSEGEHRTIGIYVFGGDIVVNGGELTGEAGDVEELSTGIWCFDGDVTVNENAGLVGKGGAGSISRGICAFGTLNVNGGVAEGTAGDATTISQGISSGSLTSDHENSVISGKAGNSEDESAGVALWYQSTLAKGELTGAAGESKTDNSYGIIAKSNEKLAIAGGVTTAQGANGAFSQAPVIDENFSEAAVWYGGSQGEADASGAKPPVNLVANYAQKYVRIADGPVYTITVTDAAADGGTVTVDRTSAREGEVVSVIARPSNGYALESFTVFDEEGVIYSTLTRESDVFIMPGCNVNIVAVFCRDGFLGESGEGEAEPEPIVPPQTGDDSNVGLWMGLMSISLAGVYACGVVRRGTKQE